VAFIDISLGALLASGGALVLLLASLLARAMKKAGLFARPETKLV
jgi:hypothetical protein